VLCSSGLRTGFADHGGRGVGTTGTRPVTPRWVTTGTAASFARHDHPACLPPCVVINSSQTIAVFASNEKRRRRMHPIPAVRPSHSEPGRVSNVAFPSCTSTAKTNPFPIPSPPPWRNPYLVLRTVSISKVAKGRGKKEGFVFRMLASESRSSDALRARLLRGESLTGLRRGVSAGS
jgi:hypothetical protein